MKVAFVYDRVNKWGGAERVLLSLQKLFPDAPLYTAVYNASSAPWARDFSIKTTYLQRIPGASSSHEFFPLLMPSAFEQFVFDEYDLVISITSEAAKGILTKPHTKHISYLLTPTRYLWSGYKQYFSHAFFRYLATPAVWYLRKWDTVASTRPDVLVSISHEVQRRVKTYYQRDSSVIYPPSVALRGSTGSMFQPKHKDYFLVVSRLVPYKRIALAIKACNALSLPLLVIGTGSEEKKLRKIAGPTITFLGKVSDEELSGYYAHCRALLFPGEEDFGLTIIEAQQHGKPVIAYQKGGALETVIDGKTGLFFGEPTVTSLMRVLETFNHQVFSAVACRSQAEKFSEKSFHNSMRKLIETVV